MILFLVSLIICILLHELAHLLVAKKCKCGVEVFSVGFGRAIIKKKIGETIYQLSWLWLGGYCKLAGELINSKNKTDFSNLSYRKKLYIIIAGCVINIITGLIALVLGAKLLNYSLVYFGLLSIVLGAGNLLPIPALDGGYIVYLPLCTKIWGKEKGYEIFAKITHIGFIIIMTLNILCIPYLIHMIKLGRL